MIKFLIICIGVLCLFFTNEDSLSAASIARQTATVSKNASNGAITNQNLQETDGLTGNPAVEKQKQNLNSKGHKLKNTIIVPPGSDKYAITNARPDDQ